MSIPIDILFYKFIYESKCIKIKKRSITILCKYLDELKNKSANTEIYTMLPEIEYKRMVDTISMERETNKM